MVEFEDNTSSGEESREQEEPPRGENQPEQTNLKFPVEVVGKGEMAKLRILDRNLGEAEIRSKGWEIGPRSWSSGKIEKASYETDLHQYQIKEDGIRLVAGDPDGGPSSTQVISRAFDQIHSVDFATEKHTLSQSKAITVFHTNSGIYRIEFVPKLGNVSLDTISKVTNYLDSRITQRNDSESKEVETTDNASKIRKLAELRGDDIITQEEFEDKKSELLEDF